MTLLQRLWRRRKAADQMAAAIDMAIRDGAIDLVHSPIGAARLAYGKPFDDDTATRLRDELPQRELTTWEAQQPWYRDGAFNSVEEARQAVAREPGTCAVVRGGLDRGGPGTCVGCGAAVGDLEVHCGRPGCPATPIKSTECHKLCGPKRMRRCTLPIGHDEGCRP